MDYKDLIKHTKVGDVDEVRKADTFANLRAAGYAPFSLGPVYVYANVAESLVEEFSKESHADVAGRPKDGRHTTMVFQHVIMTNCPGWENVLEILDFNTYQWFKKWMLSLNFTARTKQTFYVPRHYIAPLADPIAFGKHGKHVAESLDVFSLSGMKGNLKPETSNTRVNVPTFVRLHVYPPEEDVQVLGRNMLKIIKET